MKCAVVVFVKYSQPGKVKTRLGKDIGYEAAAELYTAFVEDMLGNMNSAGLDPIITYDPFQPKEKYREWLGQRIYIPQQGNDLGERMHNALLAAFEQGFDSCILTGSDLPDLDPDCILQARQSLKKAPVCIGPASDGGYYLIGFQKKYLTDSIFKNMEWSTEKVFPETISRLKKQGITPAILPEHQDMDTVEDLKNLLSNPKALKLCPKSLASLAKNYRAKSNQN
ncbi:TIGR04282 family arsenosugar biosynthesis glycosyltransferase [Desulfovibrio sp. JC022]|uniref:TIGR04282 family arsenosugar biosynthesis glycosyltransferase n=1 Tax=Desulfovibrio sp. JC022 TaxID=2593642 RepID=UPI0013D5CCCC|nr:TIGR04282 family arsenosugar biosynthesis glycosyltransferase [Desulfovibrio sp. JC022]NDV21512.1 glycosyltransferase [Desulfovibrio sp. JC022]